jgi:hypothetical protein
MKPSSDIPILRATNGEVLRAIPLCRVVLSSARASRHNLFVEKHRIPCNRGLEQLRKGDGRLIEINTQLEDLFTRIEFSSG